MHSIVAPIRAARGEDISVLVPANANCHRVDLAFGDAMDSSHAFLDHVADTTDAACRMPHAVTKNVDGAEGDKDAEEEERVEGEQNFCLGQLHDAAEARERERSEWAPNFLT